jgi:hypothetical protein
MLKRIALLIVSVIAILLLSVGCYPQDKVVIQDTPAVNVNVTGGTITATVPTPLPVDIEGVDNVSNMLRVSSQDYLYSIAEGSISGHTPFAKLGFNGDVGTNEEDIWINGGIYVFPDTPMQMELLSSSVEDDPTKADTSAGTGVWSVRVSYLDNTYAEQTEVVALNGTGVVTTVATNILRVNALRAVTVGSTYKAVGTITIRNLADTPIYRQIGVGYTRGREAIYTVPLGKTLYITSVAVSSGYSTVGKNVRWTARANLDDVGGTILPVNFFMPYFEIQTQDSTFIREFELPMKIPATVDIKMSAISDSANSVCTVAIRGWLE